MKKLNLLLIIFLTITSCSTTKNTEKVYKKLNLSIELTERELKEFSYISRIKSYKSSYTELIPYLYNNIRGDYNELQGDFFNIKVKNYENLNLLCSYRENAEEKNVLRCMIRKSSTSKYDFKKSIITVKSSNYGMLTVANLKSHPSYLTHPALLFLKKIQLNKSSEIIEKIKNDTITIMIDDEKFELISPEFK